MQTYSMLFFFYSIIFLSDALKGAASFPNLNVSTQTADICCHSAYTVGDRQTEFHTSSNFHKLILAPQELITWYEK